jgi:hypothetical protein
VSVVPGKGELSLLKTETINELIYLIFGISPLNI